MILSLQVLRKRVLWWASMTWGTQELWCQSTRWALVTLRKTNPMCVYKLNNTTPILLLTIPITDNLIWQICTLIICNKSNSTKYKSVLLTSQVRPKPKRRPSQLRGNNIEQPPTPTGTIQCTIIKVFTPIVQEQKKPKLKIRKLKFLRLNNHPKNLLWAH